MKNLSTSKIREMFLEYFIEKGHWMKESESLVPINDNSLLFINSGVATLKKYFDGSQIPPSNRICNSQRAIRTNDIENVGVTSRHHTLFEMLGNFSIGEYFKEEAIEYAFELLTNPRWFDIDIEKLYFTVHPNDDVTYNKWIDLGVCPGKIVKLEENFWEIGKGPGGPNTEIFFDRGESYDNRNVIELLLHDEENDRIIEIWNIVFSQYNCAHGELERENYEELPQKNIDTGMGLERIACILQNVETNFEIDIFINIINNLENTTGISYKQEKMAYRVIADHIRALTFAIADGVLPTNDGRGYVIRRILRRAVRFGYNNLEQEGPFLAPLVDVVIESMKNYYPYLVEQKEFIKHVITNEEIKFFGTLEDGLKLLNKEIKQMHKKVLDGEVAFKMYDTYGFPIELTREVLADKNCTIDEEGFNLALEEQRKRARSASNKTNAISKQNPFLKEIKLESSFIGYEQIMTKSNVIMLTDLVKEIDSVEVNLIHIILDNTPFYAESGGQVADEGTINGNNVLDVQKLPNGQHIHLINVVNPIKKGDKVECIVNKEIRNQVTNNHSATHLLHYALKHNLGNQIKQAGSLQDSEKTRFDFNNLEHLTIENIKKINQDVQEMIDKKLPVEISQMPLVDVKKIGAEALFGEKYGDIVRVVKMGNSIELCGGTHVKNTSEINEFVIVREFGIGSGVRRIEALTGDKAKEYKVKLQESFDNEYSKEINKLLNGQLATEKELLLLIDKLIAANCFKNDTNNKILKLRNLNEEVKKDQKDKQKDYINKLTIELLKNVKQKNGINYIEATIKDINKKHGVILIDQIIGNLQSGVVILNIIEGNKVAVIVKVTPDVVNEFNANVILQSIIKPYNGRGGGKETMAQGGYVIK